LARPDHQRGARNGSLHEADLIGVLVDHDGSPYSICCHAQDMPSVVDQQQTIASLVMNLSTGTLRAAWGNPCEATFAEHTLASQEPSDEGSGVG
jgi:isopenicillin-N N-acyltransferase-like protein